MKEILYSLPISLIFGILVFYINWNYFSLLTILIFIIYIFYYDTAKDWRKFKRKQNL
jgi:ABC-type transport system involved in Fe-S cluster assembly fused permease/ATPase subunit